MHQILCYNSKAVAIIEFLPGNPYQPSDLTDTLSPDDGVAAIVEVDDADLQKLRQGQQVLAVANSLGELDED